MEYLIEKENGRGIIDCTEPQNEINEKKLSEAAANDKKTLNIRNKSFLDYLGSKTLHEKNIFDINIKFEKKVFSYMFFFLIKIIVGYLGKKSKFN